MRWIDYCKIKYFIQKEYSYYLNVCGRYQEHKADFEHYNKLNDNIAKFEREAITKALENISKEDFKKLLDK